MVDSLVGSPGGQSASRPYVCFARFREERDFLLLAQKDRIIRIQLETQKVEALPLNSLQNVIAIEYDMRTKCVFYADIVTDVISVRLVSVIRYALRSRGTTHFVFTLPEMVYG